MNTTVIINNESIINDIKENEVTSMYEDRFYVLNDTVYQVKDNNVEKYLENQSDSQRSWVVCDRVSKIEVLSSKKIIVETIKYSCGGELDFYKDLNLYSIYLGSADNTTYTEPNYTLLLNKYTPDVILRALRN